MAAGFIAISAATGTQEASGGQEARPADAATIASLQAEVRTLERQTHLAADGRFYLVLDPEADELRLMLGGAVLRQFPVTLSGVSHPRLLFVRPEAGPAWLTSVWRHGSLAPPRPITSVVLDAPEAPVEEAVEPAILPPTVEESMPVPPRFFVRFADGLALEIVRTDRPQAGFAADATHRFRNHWADVIAVTSRTRRDAVRVRLGLANSVADALYRSLPDDIGLMVVERR